MGEGEGGMIWENSSETCILSSWNRSPAQVGCMRQVLRAGALGWQKPLQYCKVISLQLIKINEKKEDTKKKEEKKKAFAQQKKP